MMTWERLVELESRIDDFYRRAWTGRVPKSTVERISAKTQCRLRKNAMALDIPPWLEGQTITDIHTLGRALLERDLAGIRCAGEKVAQDIRYIRDFGSGLVRRRSAANE
jgi:hypothetical protein